MTLDEILPKSSAPAENKATDVDLRELAADANYALQQIQYRVGRDVRDSAMITFPRGYLIEIGRWRLALPFVRSALVRDSVADTLMMHDVQRWVLRRTDIGGHARDMLVKAAIGALGSIAEALLIDATSPPMGQRQKFASRVERLHSDGVLTGAAADDLTWLWEIRNRQHLHALSAREFDAYKSDDHPRAEACVARLILALQTRTFSSLAAVRPRRDDSSES
jgi:hypothetical protein